MSSKIHIDRDGMYTFCGCFTQAIRAQGGVVPPTLTAMVTCRSCEKAWQSAHIKADVNISSLALPVDRIARRHASTYYNRSATVRYGNGSVGLSEILQVLAAYLMELSNEDTAHGRFLYTDKGEICVSRGYSNSLRRDSEMGEHGVIRTGVTIGSARAVTSSSLGLLTSVAIPEMNSIVRRSRIVGSFAEVEDANIVVNNDEDLRSSFL